MYQFLKRMEENPDISVLRRLWGRCGRPKLISPFSMNAMVHDMNASKGQVFGWSDVHDILVARKKELAVKNGLVPISKQSGHVTPKTTGFYTLVFACHEGVSVAEGSTPKTDTRYMAENSLMLAMAFMTTIAATHFIIGSPDLATRKKILASSEPAQYLHNTVSKVLGDLPLLPVKPQYVYSQDNMTTYAFSGIETSNPGWLLVGADSNSGAGARSKYSPDNNPGAKNGLRVKSTLIFNAMGQMATPCISVSGLNDRELPPEFCPTGILSLKIEGLCIGGNSMMKSHPEMELPHSYLLFCCNDNDKLMDVKRYCFIFEELLLPFVKSNRQQHDGWIFGTPVPDSLFAVAWCDGDLPQITHATHSDSLEVLAKNKIFANKQSAARSGTEQAADLTRTFKFLNRLQKKSRPTTRISHSGHFLSNSS